MIKCIYGDYGGLGVSIFTHSRTTVWGRINNINIDMKHLSIDLINLFYRYGNTRVNSNMSNWCWSLNGGGEFTVSSLRKEIDNKLFESTNLPTILSKLVPRKINVFTWRWEIVHQIQPCSEGG